MVWTHCDAPEIRPLQPVGSQRLPELRHFVLMAPEVGTVWGLEVGTVWGLEVGTVWGLEVGTVFEREARLICGTALMLICGTALTPA